MAIFLTGKCTRVEVNMWPFYLIGKGAHVVLYLTGKGTDLEVSMWSFI